jgi:hypothetical protein
VVLAYTYLASAFIGLAYSKFRGRVQQPRESRETENP